MAILETERLIIRQFEVGDEIDMFNNWASDTDVTKWVSWQPHKNIMQSKKLIKLWKDQDSKNNNNYHYAIELKETGKVIGNVSAVRFKEKFGYKQIEIGYVVAKNYWNNGIATEAVNAFVDYLFMVKDINRITIAYDVDNFASAKVASKCGFQKEGILREYDGNNLHFICDVAVTSLLKKEWEKNKK